MIARCATIVQTAGRRRRGRRCGAASATVFRHAFRTIGGRATVANSRVIAAFRRPDRGVFADRHRVGERAKKTAPKRGWVQAGKDDAGDTRRAARSCRRQPSVGGT